MNRGASGKRRDGVLNGPIGRGVMAILLAISAAAVSSAAPPAGRVLDLSQALRLALTTSPILVEARNEVAKAKAGVGRARSLFLPRISLSYSYRDLNKISSRGPGDPDYLEQRDKSFSVTAVETLFAGLTVVNGYQRAKLALASEKERARERRLQVVATVQQRFIQLLRAKAEAESYRAAVSRLEEQMKAARAMLQKELISYTDFLSVKVNLADARQKLSRAMGSIDVARARLKEAIGLPQSIVYDFKGDLADFDYSPGISLGRCLSCAMAASPALRLLDLAVKMARKDYQIVWGRFAPRVELSAGYNIYNRDYKFMGRSFYGPYDPDQWNEYWTAGLTVRWDLFDGGSRRYDLMEASAEVARLEARRREIHLKVEADIRADFFRFKDAAGRIEVARGALEQARENYRRATKRFAAMIESRLELLRAQDDLVTAEVNLSRARADYLMALSQLYYDMGVENPRLAASMAEAVRPGGKGGNAP